MSKGRREQLNDEYGEAVGPAIQASITQHMNVGRTGTVAEIAEDKRRHDAFVANRPSKT